jgi:hypothetical protein
VTRDNVARRLHIQDVVHGIAQGTNQRDFYICDNDIDGRLFWPWALDPDASDHWDDRGVAVHGDGHVVCHNRIRGFGDPMINMKDLARSLDFYGNDILDTFDGTEVDLAAGNVRVFHNRWTNVAAGVSLQPIRGGPAYVLRNVFLNVVDEQIKYKSLGGIQEPSGGLFYHNTFVSPKIALNLQTPITGHNFLALNNLFVGPREPLARAVEWTAGIDRGRFDFNGYFPDGGFWLGTIGGVFQAFPDFAGLQASGVFEAGGTLLREPVFAGGFVGAPGDGGVRQDPADFALDPASNAVDRFSPGSTSPTRAPGPTSEPASWDARPPPTAPDRRGVNTSRRRWIAGRTSRTATRTNEDQRPAASASTVTKGMARDFAWSLIAARSFASSSFHSSSNPFSSRACSA